MIASPMTSSNRRPAPIPPATSQRREIGGSRIQFVYNTRRGGIVHLQVRARMCPLSPTFWPNRSHSPAFALCLLSSTRLPLASSIVIVSSSRLSLRSRSSTVDCPCLSFIVTGLSLASVTWPLVSVWNTFHDENGGFLSF